MQHPFAKLSLLVVVIVTLAMVSPSVLANQTPTASPHSTQMGSNTVTIIVADNFPNDETYTPPASNDDTCVMSSETQGYAVRGAGYAVRGAGYAVRGASVAENENALTHGQVVVQQIEETLADMGYANDTNITIVEVNISSGDDMVAVNAIETAIADASASDFIVLNMSFAFVPCEFLEAMEAFGGEFLDANKAGQLNRYRGIFQRAVVFYDNQVFPVNSNKFQNATDLHPLQTVFETHSNVIPIASAGNFGLKYPFWPAAFVEVTSVSASNGVGFNAAKPWVKQGQGKDEPLLSIQGNGNNQQIISNYGEVMLPGEYEVEPNAWIIGTSFAAPRLTALSAVYVSNVGSAYCKTSDGYFGLAYGKYDNLTLAQAISAHCPTMATYAP